MLHGPVRVGHAVEREVVALVGQAEVLGALEVVEHAKGVGVELVGLSSVGLDIARQR